MAEAIVGSSRDAILGRVRSIVGEARDADAVQAEWSALPRAYNVGSAADRHEVLERLIDRYRCGVQPLLAPITMLKHYMAEYPHPWLAQQRYFDPYPEALRLRYGQ